MEPNTEIAEPWLNMEDRRVLREYPTVQQALDDIWHAHQQGWLPLSMNEERRSERVLAAPWTWFRKNVTYVVAYRHGGR
jgi:hypothetical protein